VLRLGYARIPQIWRYSSKIGHHNRGDEGANPSAYYFNKIRYCAMTINQLKNLKVGDKIYFNFGRYEDQIYREVIISIADNIIITSDLDEKQNEYNRIVYDMRGHLLLLTKNCFLSGIEAIMSMVSKN
jgi:hypothetical protein